MHRVGASQGTAAQNMCLVTVMSSHSNTKHSLPPRIGEAVCAVLGKNWWYFVPCQQVTQVSLK